MTRFQPPTTRDFERRWAERIGWRFAKNAERSIGAMTGKPVDGEVVQVLASMFAKALQTNAPDPRQIALKHMERDLRHRRRLSEGATS